MPSNHDVPEDLKAAHRIFSTGKNVRPTAEEYVALIERIGTAEQEAATLRAALKDVLSRLPSMEIIEALKADAGLGYRRMPMKPTPTDADVVKWMAALAETARSK